MEESKVDRKSPKKNPKIEKIRKDYYPYLERSGISVGFQIIFNEIVGKGIKEQDVFEYTAKRLRDFKEIVDKNKMKEQIEKDWSQRFDLAIHKSVRTACQKWLPTTLSAGSIRMYFRVEISCLLKI